MSFDLCTQWRNKESWRFMERRRIVGGGVPLIPTYPSDVQNYEMRVFFTDFDRKDSYPTKYVSKVNIKNQTISNNYIEYCTQYPHHKTISSK